MALRSLSMGPLMMSHLKNRKTRRNAQSWMTSAIECWPFDMIAALKSRSSKTPIFLDLESRALPLKVDPLRDRYVNTATQYQFLVNRKYRQGLSPAEIEQLSALDRELNEMDEVYYRDLIRHLQALVDKKEAGS
jgi:hypothetical protein